MTRAEACVDTDRCCVALERGPLVYCLEAVDNPGPRVDDIIIDTTSAPSTTSNAALPGVTTIVAQGLIRPRVDGSWWPYQSAATSSAHPASTQTTTLTAVPYLAWGNRQEGAMRVWIPAE